MAAYLVQPYTTVLQAFGRLTAWGMSLLLCLAYGVGLLPLAYLALRLRRRKRRFQSDAAAISKGLQAEQQRLVNGLYSEHKKCLTAP